MGVVKLLIGFLAVAAVVVCLFQVVPPIMANFGFQDDIRTIALIDGSSLTKTDDDIRNDVLRKAREHDLTIDAKQVTVQRINSPGLATAYVTADYSVTVSLPGYSFDMHFNPNSGNKGF